MPKMMFRACIEALMGTLGADLGVQWRSMEFGSVRVQMCTVTSCNHSATMCWPGFYKAMGRVCLGLRPLRWIRHEWDFI